MNTELYKPYIDTNTELRENSMKNGKTIENMRKHRYIEASEAKMNYLVS